ASRACSWRARSASAARPRRTSLATSAARSAIAMALSPSHRATASAAAVRSAWVLAWPSWPRLVVTISRAGPARAGGQQRSRVGVALQHGQVGVVQPVIAQGHANGRDQLLGEGPDTGLAPADLGGQPSPR